jgi:hypothetical protein
MLDGLGANADAVFATERLAAELEQNPGKFWLFDHRHNGSTRSIGGILSSQRLLRQTKAADGNYKKSGVLEMPLDCICPTLSAKLTHEKN